MSCCPVVKQASREAIAKVEPTTAKQAVLHLIKLSIHQACRRPYAVIKPKPRRDKVPDKSFISGYWRDKYLSKAAMSHVLYAYIARPTPAQVGSFLRALLDRGVSISHLGKSDPPRKFGGSIEEAVSMVFSGTDLTDRTFARDKTQKLDFDIQIHYDPQWTHSTVSASSSDSEALGLIAQCAARAFVAFITVRGVSGGGKEQAWGIINVTESCPDDLRSRFIAA